MSSNYSMKNLSEYLYKEHFANRTEFDDLIINFAEIQNTIELFGQWMQNISINGSIMWTLNDEILELILRYCKPRQLRLCCFQINKSTVPILAQVLQFVEKLELVYCPTNVGNTHNRFDQLFQNCDQLEDLSIIHPDATMESKFLTTKFPNLTKFHLIIGKLSDTNSMAIFIKNHPKLERFVYLPQNVSTKKTIPWFNQVKKLPKNLEEFGVMMSIDDVYHHLELLSKLNGLKRIHIECNNIDKSMDAVLEELAKHKSLEVLSIWKTKFLIKFGNAFAKMTNLKTLELRQFSNSYVIDKMIKSNMTKHLNLENLYLDRTSVKNANDLTVLLENFKDLKNLYLCDVKNIFLLRGANELDGWHSRIRSAIKIIIDRNCIWQLQNSKNNNSIGLFVPFKDRMSQMFNVLIET